MQPHGVFSRRDHDILLELPINFAQAALGDELEAPTLNGTETLRIPGGTQSGTEFRIKGRGVPYSARGRRGDQVVVVNVVTPNNLDDNQKRLFAELAESLGNGSREDKGWFDRIKDAIGKDGKQP